MSTNKYYGIFIQKNDGKSDRGGSDKLHVYTSVEDVLKVTKEFGNARFKYFASEEEATYFAINGSAGGPGNPSVHSESTPFKSLKREDIQTLRGYIERDDLKSVETRIWENPRYLIGIGDTPTVLRDGPRYNALHIAAIHNSYRTADYVLKTISNGAFTQLLYGASGDQSYVVRPEVLLDRYLNTPDKALNETPLHFAVKHGSLDVVRIFVQFPQLQVNVKNRYDQTPKDMICKRFRARLPHKSSGDADVAWYTKEIRKLLDEPFYVPIWRSEEDVVQPIIGKPFSPKSPPVYPLATSPLSPTMEIKAVAGPMSYKEASTFHRTWKSPKSGTPHVSKGVLLRSPLCCDKDIEKVGRILARKFHVSWKEYWPFLDEFVDLATEDGLQSLEAYLRNIIDVNTREAEKNDFIMNSPLSDLCDAFSKFSIVSPKSPSPNSVRRKGDGDSPSTNSSYLCADNFCSTFARSLISELENNFHRNEPSENNLPLLVKRVRNLSGMINSYSNEPSFDDFPFDKIHARVAFWIRSSLSPFNFLFLRYVGSICQLVHDLGKYGDLSCHIETSPLSNVRLDYITDALKCINAHVMKLLSADEISEIGLQTAKEWSSMERCCCYSESREQCRNKERVKRSLFGESCQNQFTRPSSAEEKTEVTDTKTNCDTDMKFRILGPEICDSDSDDEYFTPNGSICNSDDEMESPDEGPELFIYDNRGTSMDNAVLEAIADVKIDRDQYPSIYRWKHSILLHHKLKRFSWPSPKIARLNSKKLRT